MDAAGEAVEAIGGVADDGWNVFKDFDGGAVGGIKCAASGGSDWRRKRQLVRPREPLLVK